jgi:protein phosphatase 1 regulatory subunit 7
MKPFIRIDNPNQVDTILIERELGLGKEVIIQFSDVTYTSETLNDIDELCSKCDENLCIRFYGHYFKAFDCKILRNIPGVKCLYLDCLTSVKNLHVVTELANLEVLVIGIFELRETEFLGSENLRNLKGLTVGETKTKSFNLVHLEKIKNLTSLRISGHTKNIESIGELSDLDSLSLNAVKQVPVGFINKLKKLRKLELLLGSRLNLNEIEKNKIEELDIVWVRGFNDLSCLSKFPKLNKLRVENQIQVAAIQFDMNSSNLSDLKIINCKRLEAISGLSNMHHLQSLVVSRTGVDFDAFMKQELPNSLSHLGFYTGKSKVDKDIKLAILEKGYSCR